MMKALILDAPARTARVESIPQPEPGPQEVLVQVAAVSLNPIDPLYVQHPLASSGRTVGSDFAGTVVSLGHEVPSSSGLHVGSRVSGFLQGACSVNDRPGAFAEYLVVSWDLVWKVPGSLMLEEAAGVSLVALTAAQGMWYRLGLQAPFEYDAKKVLEEHPEWFKSRSNSTGSTLNFFIYGASTSVGLFASQMIRISAKASGNNIRLFGAASKSKWKMLQAEPYGYEQLVDYRDEDWPEQIMNMTGSTGIHYAYDCISEGSSVEKVASILVDGGQSAVVRSRAGRAWSADQLKVEPIYGAVWEGLGEEIQYQGFTVRKSAAARDFAVKFYRWLSTGASIKPVPIRLMPGGLDRVVNDGFLLLGAGRMEERQVDRSEEWMRPVSAEKLVYRL